MRGSLPDTPQPVLLSLAALFGLVIGSFLNVCIYRVARDLSIVTPRSFCPECDRPISWYDNLPVISYLLLKGRCRHCGHSIGFSYLLVEVATAFTFVAVELQYGLSLVAAKWLIFECLLIILFWTDWQERILPDEFTLGGTLVGIVFAWFVSVPGILGEIFLSQWSASARSLVNMLAGGSLVSLPVWLLGIGYAKWRGREGLGLGDVKLLLLLGVFMGPENTLLVAAVASTGGAIASGVHLALKRKDASTYELPFGSFLCATGYFVPLLSHLGGAVYPLSL